MNRLSGLVLAAALAVPLAAQQGSFVPFGTGCTLLRQTLSIGSTGGPPRIGTPLQITYSGPNFTFNNAQQIARPYMVLGFNTFTTMIPTTLLPNQPAGCTGYITIDATVPSQPDPNQPGVWDTNFSLNIPNSASLVGAVVNAQWLTTFEQCGFAGCGLDAIATSDAARITVGV